jgi:hypothetical protein
VGVHPVWVCAWVCKNNKLYRINVRNDEQFTVFPA